MEEYHINIQVATSKWSLRRQKKDWICQILGSCDPNTKTSNKRLCICDYNFDPTKKSN